MSPLPTPKGNQPKVVFLAANQHNVVLGTAGTGKSTMAMLRARYLSQPSTHNNGPVLVVTFNKALVTYLRYLADGAPVQVTIQSYHTFAYRYLKSVDLMPSNLVAGNSQVRAFVTQAVAVISNSLSSAVLSRPIDWFIDELAWISGRGITQEADYQAVDRSGRQTPLQAGQPRSAVWAVRQAYLSLRSDSGYAYDFSDMASAVRKALENDTTPRTYRHIIIDEGQDLPAEAIRSLAATGQPGGSLTFFGDYHQAIYGQGLSWQGAGIKLGNRPIEKFQDNYRNTAQIARVAIEMAGSPYMKSSHVDLVEPRQPKADGVMPTLMRCRDVATEIALVSQAAAEASTYQKVAILTRRWAQVLQVARGLTYTKLKRNMDAWDDDPGLYVGAYHSAKGLEFDTVFMPFLGADFVPDADVVHAYSQEDAYSREARPLYVSITRARSTLIVTYSGTLSPLLPVTDGLWDKRKMM